MPSASRRAVAWLAAGLAVGLGGCKGTGLTARIDGVVPASAVAGVEATVKIIGEGFQPAVQGNFDDQTRSRVSAQFSARLGDRLLSNVTYVSASELTATVPGDLPPGTYDLSVADPVGRRATAAAAFTVLPASDAGPPDAAPDAGVDSITPDAVTPDAPAPDTTDDALAPDTLSPDSTPTGVHTVAGTGVAAFANGPAAQAAFDAPRGVAVLGTKIYVADFNNHRVRTIEAGQVSTIAGSGTQGFLDGPAASAELNLPDSVAVDPTGVVYVTDSANSCIRKIEAGQVTTFAGTNVDGLVDGPAADSRFASPLGLALAADGKLYVADAGNHRIRVIAGGTVSTLAGTTEGFADGAAAAARFSSPSGVWVDGTRVYVADTGNQRLRLIEGGQVTTIAGTGDKGQDEGPAASATFWNPSGVVVVSDAGGERIYVVDQANHAIRLIDPSGTVSTINGAGFGFANGPVAMSLFFYPRGITATPGGVLYIADQSNHAIRVIYP